MSYVNLDEVRRALVIQLDDEKVQEAIDDAEDEALKFLQLGGTDLAEAIARERSTSDSYAADGGDDGNFKAVRRAVISLVQVSVDAFSADEVERRRKVAFEQMRPYRKRVGC